MTDRGQKHPLEWAIAIMLFFTLLATATAAYFTGRQWLTAVDQEQRSLRAYVSVRVESHPDINSDHLDLTVVYKNHGQTPAFKMKAWLVMHVDDNPLPRSKLEQIEEHRDRMSGDTSTLFPAEERHGGTKEGFGQVGPQASLSDADRAAIKAGWKTLWLVGDITYEDAFGREHFTHYRLFESGEYMTRVNKLFWASEGNEAN
jgi:hypothetical protein